MGFLTYSNENDINIIPQEEFESLVHEVFNVIASNLTKSLGPLGSSATILDGASTEATKDGYSILMKYRFTNRYKNMIYNLITAPCTKMNNTVGDGTTTAIALTNAIFNEYERNKNELSTMYRLPRQFIEAWDWVINDLIKRVTELAKPIDPNDYDTIYHLAYVTSNGNHEISDTIAKTYQEVHTPSIKQKDSPTNKSYMQAINGFEFPTNLIADAFVKNEDGSATLSDIITMIFDFKIDSNAFNVITQINEVCRAQNKQLIIIAPSYDTHMCDTEANQYVNREYHSYGKLNLILTQYNYSKLTKTQLGDLAVILRSKVINEDLFNMLAMGITEHGIDNIFEDTYKDDSQYYRLIGGAKEVVLSTNSSAIFHNDDVVNDKIYKETLAAAKRDLEEITTETPAERQSYAAKIYDANIRILQLEMRNYIYYVGADSQLQKQIIWDSIEDVIKCLRSAIKYGVVPGCQLTIIKAALLQMKDIENDQLKLALNKIIQNSICNVYTRVLHGANGDGMIKLIPNWSIIDPNHVDELKKQAIDKANEIIIESINKQAVFDLDKLEFNSEIITSAQTDTMVLSVASELVKILISGNQCIFLDYSGNETTQENTINPYQ